MIAPILDTIASLPLTHNPHWVVWRLETKPGQSKPSKIPYNAKTGNRASSTDGATWHAYEAARAAYERGGYDGIGFVVSEFDPFVGVDLDGCVDDQGNIADWAQRIVDDLDTYTELSPSGTGLRLWCVGKLPDGSRNRSGSIEVYQTGRFLTVSGAKLPRSPIEIRDRESELAALAASLGEPKANQNAHTPPQVRSDFDPDERLGRMFSSSKGLSIKQLWDGDTSGYSSASEADLALVNHLLWWASGDVNQADQWFRQSGLYRPKWDQKHGLDTYGNITLNKALTDFGGGYDPTVSTTGIPVDEFEVIDNSYEYDGELLCDELSEPIERIAAGFNQPPIIATAALLTVAASCLKVGTILDIGGSTGWTVPPILWACVVGESGSTKSPYLEKLLAPLYQLQAADDAVYDAAKQQFKADLKAYEAATRNAQSGEVPDEPIKPTATERYVSDYTLEGLSRIISDQPDKGLLVWNDELRLFFASMDAYKKNGGGDRAQWLSMRNGSGLKRNRKGDDRVSVPRTAVSVLGGIQPEVLSKLINDDRDGADGLYPRFLWIRMDETRRMPPLDGTRWDASERFRSVYEGLSNLEPRDYRLSPQAFNAFNAWHMECESDRVDASNGLVKATISKYKGMAASVALILHCLNGIAAGETVSGIISESTMINAIEFTRWAIKQAKSLFAVNAITTDEETALLNRFVERFDGKGWVTGDIARSWWPSKKKPGRKEVREFLHGLVTSGVAIDNGEKPEKTTYSISLNLKNVVHSSKKSEPLVSQGFETGRKFRPVVVQNVVQKYPDVVQTDPDEDPIQSGRTLDESGRTLDESIVRPQTHTPQGFEKKTDEWTKKPDESENGRTDEAANSDNIDCNQSIELSPEVAAELAAIELFLGDLADEFK